MRYRALREPGDGESPRVTNLELFFDLVYVFAITQVSDFMFEHLTGRGAVQTLVLFIAVWWAWNYTAWATNWIDPDRPAAAAVMVVMMVLGLVMAAALPDAFGSGETPDRALVFAIAYVALQVVRTGFVALAFPRGDRMRANNLRLLAWLAIGGAVWIVGALLHGDARLGVWLLAVAVELAAPLHGFWLPGRGSTPIEAWQLTGSHLAERYQLVLIIALGESVLRVGATFAHQHGSVAVDASFLVGFLASATLWGVYFLRLAERGAASVAGAEESAARMGRTGYAYAHAVMVAGVIVVAVAIRATIEHPTDPVDTGVTVAVLAGPALYLAGLALFERSIGLGAIVYRPMVAIAALGLLALAAVAGADRLLLSAAATAILLAFLGFVAVRPYHEHPRVDVEPPT